MQNNGPVRGMMYGVKKPSCILYGIDSFWYVLDHPLTKKYKCVLVFILSIEEDIFQNE